MKNKTLLVAQREFVENLRTKAFWIGILSLPIIFALFIFVGRLLQESKDVRSYTIVDRSAGQWLSQAIDERAARNDLRQILDAALRGTPEDREEARQKFEEWYGGLADDHPLRDLERRLAQFEGEVDLQDVMVGELSGIPSGAKREVVQWGLDVAADEAKLKALKQIASSISLARYRRVDFDDLGADPQRALNEKINKGALFAYFVIGDDPVESDESSLYISNNVTDNDLRNWFEEHATQIVRERRIANLDLTPEQAATIQARFDFHERKVTETGEAAAVGKEEKASSFAPVAFVYLLWIAVFTAAQMLLTNTVEEKSNRLIEVLLSSVSPMQLMAGKVLGIAATGLTIVLSWVLTAIVGSKLAPEGAFGGIDLVSIIGDPLYLSSFVAYFLAGYLLYAAFLVAIGSVCNSLKEAQNLMQPVFIVLIVPLVAMVFVVQDPNGAVARFLTYIPLFTPFLMMNRAGGPPPAWEYVVSTIVIVVSLWIVFVGAAKVFRVGILMTGKPPKLREILRWLRAPVGQVPVQRSDSVPR